MRTIMNMSAPYPLIVMRGAGDLATGVALRLYRAGLRSILMLETERPLAVRRTVAFSEAVYHGGMTVEGVTAVCVTSRESAFRAWSMNAIPVMVDPQARVVEELRPDVLVDAIVAKRNTGTSMAQAPLVIGLGPGFVAGEDVHKVVETKRGHHLGRVIENGAAAPNTGVPGDIGGYTLERVYWASQAGVFTTRREIGDTILDGEMLGMVNDTPIVATVSGIIRGLLRSGTPVRVKTKLGDVDPRGALSYCDEVSDKALAIGGGVLEAVSAHLFALRLAA